MLHALFSKLFQTCVLPSVWLKAITIPVPKSSSKYPYVPLNYRGISLLSCVGKAFSGIINKHVVNYCEDNNIYEDEQNGFRKKRSCENNIFALTSIIKNGMSENKIHFVVLLIYKKLLIGSIEICCFTDYYIIILMETYTTVLKPYIDTH